MKREQRVLAIVGNGQVVVSVLYRGRFWFESLEVKVFNGKKESDEVFSSKYLEQARFVLIDERLLKHFKIDTTKALSALIPRGREVEVIVISEGCEESSLFPREKIKRLCVQGDVPEALRVARRIFNEVRSIASEII
jgi:hypothetical protein